MKTFEYLDKSKMMMYRGRNNVDLTSQDRAI